MTRAASCERTTKETSIGIRLDLVGVESEVGVALALDDRGPGDAGDVGVHEVGGPEGDRRASMAAEGEAHGLSVFFRTDDDVFHTYSSFARGVESLTDAYSLLDTTPYGRQQDWEDSPPGWPQQPTYG